VAGESLDADTIGAEKLDLLIAASRGEIFCRTRSGWRLFEAGDGGEVLVGCRRRKSATFDYVFMCEESLLQTVAFRL
jgi:hypothetical protein